MDNQLKESNFVIYENEECNVNIDVVLKDETIWLTQKSMAELFDTSVDNISLHLKNIYKEMELDKIVIDKEKMKTIFLQWMNYIKDI